MFDMSIPELDATHCPSFANYLGSWPSWVGTDDGGLAREKVLDGNKGKSR